MKKIKIIGIICILVILGETVFSFTEDFQKGAQSAKDGWGAAERCATFNHAIPCFIEVKPVAETQDSLYNTALKQQVPYVTSQVETWTQLPGWNFSLMILMILMSIAAFSYLFGFYCLIRLLISTTRRQVFTKKNVFRIRLFAYSQAASLALLGLYDWMITHYAMQQLQFPGYEITGGGEVEVNWTLIMITILLAEIFAAGVKIKEEQDLTV